MTAVTDDLVNDPNAPTEAKHDPKQVVFDNLNAMYQPFMDYIKALPMDENVRRNAITNFDQGLMWLEQGIRALVVVDVPVENTQTPAEPVVIEGEVIEATPE